MQFFPVATVAGKAPTYTDDFDPTGQRIGRQHCGIDIFADEGTPVLAPDDGTIRHNEEGKGGHVVYLTRADGVSYFLGHLSAYEGDARSVKAGDTIGYVGHTGNAVGTSPHTHFEIHDPSAPDVAGCGSVINPFPELQSAGAVIGLPPPPQTTPPSTTSSSSTPLTLGAKALAKAYELAHGRAPERQDILYALAQAIGEGTFGPTYANTNNWGSIHATRAFENAHKGDQGYGMFAHLDSMASGYYITRLVINPSPLLGAQGFLARIESAIGSLASASWAALNDLTEYCTLLYISGYFTGSHGDVTPYGTRTKDTQWTEDDKANIADYAALLARTVDAARAAIDNIASEPGDPAAVHVGPPFATLAERLTPYRPPHTIEHAKELLGAAAKDPPAGAISLADALNAPGKDGVWLYGIPEPPPPPKKHPPRVPQPEPTTSPAPVSALRVLATALGLVVAVFGGAAIVSAVAQRVPRRAYP